MKLEIEINDKQVEFLKQFALKQYDGAKDNIGTNKPMHLVQRKDIDYLLYYPNIEEYLSGKVVFRICEGEWYLNIQDAVTNHFKELGEQPPYEIKSFDECNAILSEDANGNFRYVETYEDYFTYYGIKDYLIMYQVETWDTVAYFFTLSEAKKYLEYQKHNIVEDARTYTVHMGYGNNGDYEPFWDLLMSIGKQLNEPKENAGNKELQVPSFIDAEIIKPEETEDFLKWIQETENRLNLL